MGLLSAIGKRRPFAALVVRLLVSQAVPALRNTRPIVSASWARPPTAWKKERTDGRRTGRLTAVTQVFYNNLRDGLKGVKNGGQNKAYQVRPVW